MRTKGRTTAVFGTIILVLMALVLAPTSFASCSTGVEENEDVVVAPTATSTSTPIPEPTQTPIPEPTQTPTLTAIPTPTPRTISFLDESVVAGSTKMVVGGAVDYAIGASFIVNFGGQSQEQIKVVGLGFERRPNRGVHILTLDSPLLHPHANGERVSEATIPTPYATSTPFPYQVPQGLVSASRIPSIEQVPMNVKFSFDASTAQTDRDALRLGVERASQLYAEVLGKYGSSMTFVTVTSGCKGVVATYIAQDVICVNILHPDWMTRSFEEKFKTGAHEYFHNIQSVVGCKVGWDSGGQDLVWLGEGAAEFYAIWTISEAGMTPLHQKLNLFKIPLRVNESLSLADMEMPTIQEFSYSLSAVAVDLLVSKSSIGSYVEYCELRSSGIQYEDAFHQAFGLTVPEFYEQFELYRANGYK